jgi:hypothetical protein
VVKLVKGAVAVADVTQQLQQQYQDLQAATQQQQQQQQQQQGTPDVEVVWEPDAWPRAFSRDQCRSKDTGIFTWVPPGLLPAGDGQEEDSTVAGMHSSSNTATSTSAASSSSGGSATAEDMVGSEEGVTKDVNVSSTNSSSRSSPDSGSSSKAGFEESSTNSSTNSSSSNSTSSSSKAGRSSPCWSWLSGKPGWQHLVPPGDWSDVTGTAGDAAAAGCKQDQSSWAAGGQHGLTVDQGVLTAFLGDVVAEDCGISSGDASELECGGQDV